MAQVAPDSQSCTHRLLDRLLFAVCMVHIAVHIASVVQVAEEQAALDALSELGMQQGGAEAILLHPCQVIQVTLTLPCLHSHMSICDAHPHCLCINHV